MQPEITVSFDVAAGGMERLRNQNELIHATLLEPQLTARDILTGLEFDLDRDDATYQAMEAARPDASNETINNLCDFIDSQIIAAVTQYLTAVTKGNLDKVNPFDIEAPDDSGEGCSLFVYVASPLFRHGAE